MTPIELAEKAFKVFNLQDTKEAPVIDLPIYYGEVLLASIRLKHTNGSWKGELADWEMKDIVDCFEHPDKYGIKNTPTEQENKMIYFLTYFLLDHFDAPSIYFTVFWGVIVGEALFAILTGVLQAMNK